MSLEATPLTVGRVHDSQRHEQEAMRAVQLPEGLRRASMQCRKSCCAHLHGLLVHAAQQHEQDGLLDVQVAKHSGRQGLGQLLIDLAVILHRQHLSHAMHIQS